jgi:hypothetical protein
MGRVYCLTSQACAGVVYCADLSTELSFTEKLSGSVAGLGCWNEPHVPFPEQVKTGEKRRHMERQFALVVELQPKGKQSEGKTYTLCAPDEGSRDVWESALGHEAWARKVGAACTLHRTCSILCTVQQGICDAMRCILKRTARRQGSVVTCQCVYSSRAYDLTPLACGGRPYLAT